MPRLERLPLHPESALLSLYRGATQLGAPLIVAALKRRAARAKENPVRVPERLGQASAPRPAGPLLWLHGASVGESLAILPLLTALLAARPALQVLVSTGTVTSARLLGERLPARARHQFAPVDRAAAWRSFLAHWRPQLAVLVESELWPNLILETRRRGVPMALINVRMSARSHRRWSQVPGVTRGCSRPSISAWRKASSIGTALFRSAPGRCARSAI
jgi:3-deoxy-D-manno-octulosonic-acid transferase